MPGLKHLKWEDNPCGLNEDEPDVGIAEEIILTDIFRNGKLLLERTEDLRMTWKETFEEVDEDSLESQEYSFLKIDINVTSVFKDSYLALQVCSRAMEILIQEIDSHSARENQYFEDANTVRSGVLAVLCNLQISLINKEKYDMNKIEIPTYVINPGKYNRYIRDAIFLRQIEENVRQVLDTFEKYKENVISL